MKIKEQVLSILEKNKGGFVSGEEIAESLSVSRNAVWKSVNALKKDGHIITAVTNKGYSLAENSNVFTPHAIYEQFNPKLKERLNISIVPVVGSTNSELKALAEKGGEDGTVLIALEQTEGRGRLGRSFYSPKDTGLYMSILLRPDFSAEESLYITACAAVAAAEAIEWAAEAEAGIKWVNDIYIGGKKTCGILTEASLDFESGRLNYAVLGIGINLTTREFPDELRDIAAPASDSDEDMRSFTAGEFLESFFAYYDNLKSRSFLHEYRRRSILIGKEISFMRGNEVFEGKVIGIDDRVRLMVELKDGEVKAFSSGEVALVKDGFIK